jgi:hypothetical protein
MKTWLIAGIFCGSLFAISGPAAAACTSPGGCLKCTLDGTCVTVQEDQHCECTQHINPYWCVALESCDYTGTASSCENPTPEGECPNFAPTTPKDDAASLSVATSSRTGATVISVKSDEAPSSDETVSRTSDDD